MLCYDSWSSLVLCSILLFVSLSRASTVPKEEGYDESRLGQQHDEEYYYDLSDNVPYSLCGNCHCIPSTPGGACPPWKLPTTFSQAMLDRLTSRILDNPMTLSCDPYQSSSCETVPPRNATLVAMGDAAVCGILMSTAAASSCPTHYTLKTFSSHAQAVASGAIVTHGGACGVCSTLQDLAAYIQHPDLTSPGTHCGLISLFNTDSGIRCFQDLGFTESCSKIWMYDAWKTRSECLFTCLGQHAIFGHFESNGPPPACTLNKCLACDEKYSGPLFKAFAGRTRRRSGLLSTIVRPCAELIENVQLDPCPASDDEEDDHHDNMVKATEAAASIW